MTLLNLIIVLVVIGLALYLINKYIPMQQTIKTILNIAVIVILVIWLLKVTGLMNGLNAPVVR